MIGKEVSAFGKSENLEKKNSVQVNKNLFSVRHYGFSAKSVSLNVPEKQEYANIVSKEEFSELETSFLRKKASPTIHIILICCDLEN